MFVPNTPVIRNDYALAIANALAAFDNDADLTFYVCEASDFGHTNAKYSVQGAANGLAKLLEAMELTNAVVKGKNNGKPAVAIGR
jgi:hypothetical protein